MNYFFNNGLTMRLDKESFLQKYGCLKIDYKEYEDKRYYIYAFDNSLSEWDFSKGELLLVTQDKNIVDTLKKIIFTIEVGEFFCKRCFQNKNIEGLSDTENTQFWGESIWEKTPLRAKKRLQDEILFSMPDVDWSMIQYLTDSKESSIFHGICNKYCMKSEEYKNSNIIQEREKNIQMLWKKLIAYELLDGSEEFLEDYLCDYIEDIEEGMVFVSRQDRIDYGVIDILAKDKNNVRCVIELKIGEPDKNILWQSAYYPSYFEEEKIRMITIAPDYPPKIYNALQNVKNVEMKMFCTNEEGMFEIRDFKVEPVQEIQRESDNAIQEIKDAI
ncbi:DUF91 domain-containing protein [Bacillus cereus]|uniref:endonuclease NucS domain-containing protein n=1 Tax=Bacillus cereus TaxID=1396 RepID=UPI0018F2D547|nr:DUF91 domain-containing protein [Bacillus cereus]